MVVDAVLRLPAQAQAERHVAANLPVILGKEPHVQQVDGSQRVSAAMMENWVGPLARTFALPPGARLKACSARLVGCQGRESERPVEICIGDYWIPARPATGRPPPGCACRGKRRSDFAPRSDSGCPWSCSSGAASTAKCSRTESIGLKTSGAVWLTACHAGIGSETGSVSWR